MKENKIVMSIFSASVLGTAVYYYYAKTLKKSKKDKIDFFIK